MTLPQRVPVLLLVSPHDFLEIRRQAALDPDPRAGEATHFAGVPIRASAYVPRGEVLKVYKEAIDTALDFAAPWGWGAQKSGPFDHLADVI